MCGVPHDIFPHLWQEMVLVFSCIQEFLNIPSKPYFLVNYTWCTWYLCSMHVMYIKTICCVVHMYTIYTYSILFNHVHNYIWYDNSDILLLHIHTLHYIIIYIYTIIFIYTHTALFGYGSTVWYQWFCDAVSRPVRILRAILTTFSSTVMLTAAMHLGEEASWGSLWLFYNNYPLVN